jgi:hypothetical protein
MEVANPSSQDRTPRCAIVLAVSSAAAPYRASGLVLWHETVMPVLSPQVRYEEVNGPSSVAVRGQSLTLNGPQARAIASMATSIRRGCQRRNRPLPAQASPRGKTQRTPRRPVKQSLLDYPSRDCVRAIIFHEWCRLVARDRLVAERHRHRPLSSYPGSTRSAPTVNRIIIGAMSWFVKRTLGSWIVSARFHVDVGAERRQVGFPIWNG